VVEQGVLQVQELEHLLSALPDVHLLPPLLSPHRDYHLAQVVRQHCLPQESRVRLCLLVELVMHANQV
jgi:hypothetical protein